MNGQGTGAAAAANSSVIYVRSGLADLGERTCPNGQYNIYTYIYIRLIQEGICNIPSHFLTFLRPPHFQALKQTPTNGKETNQLFKINVVEDAHA